jgi:hypothetical protein
VQQQREDPAAEPAVGSGEEYDHAGWVSGIRRLDTCFTRRR